MTRTKLRDCAACPLRAGCNQVVGPKGPYDAKLMIVGEAPGQEEDIIGEPFVGRSGELLSSLLARAGIRRESAYITNVVKCRPPGNRTPLASEINTCKVWLWKEIKYVKPAIIVALGGVATRLLLKLPATRALAGHVGKLHPCPHINEALRVVPLYHPSYLLRHDGKLNSQMVLYLKAIRKIVDESPADCRI